MCRWPKCHSRVSGPYRFPALEVLRAAYEEAYKRLEGRRVGCAECVAAAEVSQARKEGRPDPYPVYERTLTHNQRKVLDDLKQYLARNFIFPRSSIGSDRDKPALFIEERNYRWLMTVKVYYVMDAQEQDRIAGLVADFLRKVERNQCRLIFLEAEVWHTWSNPEKGISGAYRGQEKLIREIFVNC
jgi:hypothetical protein